MRLGSSLRWSGLGQDLVRFAVAPKMLQVSQGRGVDQCPDAREQRTVEPAVPQASTMPVWCAASATPRSATIAGSAAVITTHSVISNCRMRRRRAVSGTVDIAAAADRKHHEGTVVATMTPSHAQASGQARADGRNMPLLIIAGHPCPWLCGAAKSSSPSGCQTLLQKW